MSDHLFQKATEMFRFIVMQLIRVNTFNGYSELNGFDTMKILKIISLNWYRWANVVCNVMSLLSLCFSIEIIRGNYLSPQIIITLFLMTNMLQHKSTSWCFVKWNYGIIIRNLTRLLQILKTIEFLQNCTWIAVTWYLLMNNSFGMNHKTRVEPAFLRGLSDSWQSISSCWYRHFF